MNRFTTLLFGLLLPFVLHANITIRNATGKVVNNDTLYPVADFLQKPPLTEIEIALYAQNSGGAPLNLGAKKTELVMSADVTHAICFAKQCYQSHIFVSPNHVLLQPNEIDSTFSGHYLYDKATHTPSADIAVYTLYDVDNPSDSARVYVVYNTLAPPPPSSVASVGNETGITVYPNPATDVVYINIAGVTTATASLVLQAADGRVIQTQTAHTGDNQFNISALVSGVYFVSYAGDGYRQTIRLLK